MTKNVKTLLKENLKINDTSVNETPLQQTLQLLRQEQLYNPHRERICFRTFLALQIKFIGWKIWLVQGLILAALCYIITIRFGNDLYYSKRYATVFICEISVMVLMTSVPFIQRSLRHKMHEQEMASYFSSIKLIVAKLIIIGIGDIFILNGILFLIVFKNYLNISSALLYAVFTVLFTSCALMYLLGHTPAQWFSPCCLGLCAALLTGIKLLNRLLPAFFSQSFSMVWISVCLVLLLLYLSQLRYIMHCSSYAKIQFE